MATSKKGTDSGPLAKAIASAMGVSSDPLSKKAIVYLRVSSSKQMNKDYDHEGFSLPAQRAACERRAASMGAEVVDEFIEKGESATSTARRKALTGLLERLNQGDIDYVIVHKLDRLARNRDDDSDIHRVIRGSGAVFVSVTENIDDTPGGQLLHGIMASINQFYSQNLAAEVIKGTTEKARRGGTPGRPQIGYINDRVIVDGHEVRMVSVDEERGPFITAAFQLYATGDYSLPELAAILEERGFRNRARKDQPTVPVGPNRLSDILRSDYYIGVVRYRDVVAQGRHPRLIDEATFQRVQEILDARKIAGERSWRHLHYLRGTIYCGECGSRLMYTRATGRRGGIYEYFVCCAKRLGKCDQPYHRAEAVEAAVEREYYRVRLTQAQRAKIRSDVHAYSADIDAQAEPERRQTEQTLLKLQAQEKKLLQAHYEDGISPELFAEEQRRIRRERVAAETRLTALEADHGAVLGNLEVALELTDRTEEAYRIADPTARRLLNQAIFERIWIEREQVSERRIASPLREVLDQDVDAEDGAELGDAREETTPTAFSCDGGCDVERMVPPAGIEPASRA